MITRPPVEYDDKTHSYTLHGEKLLGVSTVSKIGEDTWGPASWWGWRVGYEGANEAIRASFDGYQTKAFSNDELREELKRRRLTPNAKRDKRGREGSWTHDALESLAQTGTIPSLDKVGPAVRGHVQALLRWYLAFRPFFVATEVQVASETHRFAGRYDIRCEITAEALHKNGHGEVPVTLGHGVARCLVDLKTSKRVYPTSHFAQLAGYELASVEMGFPRTDAQFVLNTHEDGTYHFVRSTARPEHFLAYLAAANAKREIEQGGRK